MPLKRNNHPLPARLEWRLAEGRVESVPESGNPGSSWVALDFETANEQRDSVCAVGIARVAAGRIVDRRSWLVRPAELRFNGINISIHGITEADVREAPTFDRLWPELKPILSEGTVIAHNAGFDMSVLRHTLDRYRIPYPPIRYLCTVTLSRLSWPRLTNHKLNTVADHLGLSLKHHDAEDDAVACAGVSLHCCRRSNAVDVDELADRLGIRHGRLHRNGYTPPRKVRRRA
ncbi:MAG: 3'-5' exonuclease [Acidobacteria bacterium]|uniref:3'-5' exonuclease n=1 Tax=Candidatus Polarisedimenticola svalbardensis TaxID=2886004 RepID=A0A8J6XZN5_9BACT|nr:3'-5' exonuclease [Candidatus Polarisedimenticola svalbardensis]